MSTAPENGEQSRPLRDLCRHPAIWTFAVCWIAAMVCLLVRFGLCDAVTVWSGRCAGVLLFCWLTVLMTETPPATDSGNDRQWKLWVTVALLVLVVLRTSGWLPWWTLPGAGKSVHLAGNAAEGLGLPYNYGRNPAAFCLIPLLFLVPFTGFRYLGLERGHRTWRVVALWCAIPLLIVAGSLASGTMSLGRSAKELISNTMQNGPWEEFLWRGAIQTRLVVLVDVPWGIVLSSLGFGIWHFNAQLGHSDGDIAVALARTIVMQSVVGLSCGIMYWRTRNLAACSICHVVFNTVV